MIFLDAVLKGAYLIELEPSVDERGFFARSWSRSEFRARGLNAELSQCSMSYNSHQRTLRGMHYQAPPHREAKVVMCTRGRVYDALVDLRKDSETYLEWFGAELSQDNRRMLYVPEGVAHGFLTLRDETDVFYQIAGDYVPEAARGVRWNDPAFGIEWPEEPRTMSPRDRGYEDFVP